MRGRADGVSGPELEAPRNAFVQWAEEELGGADLGDARRTARLVKIAAEFLQTSEGSIPKACRPWHEAKAAYRFFQNSDVDPKAILAAHRARTVERAREHPVALAIGDTSMLDYTGHPATEGLGPLSDLVHQGLMVQPTLCVTPDRVPLGLLDLQTWVRKRKGFGESKTRHLKKSIRGKESFKWLLSLQAGEVLQQELLAQGATTRVVAVFDREGDVFEVLAQAAAPQTCCRLLVRASSNRRVEHPQQHLWSHMEAQPRAGELRITVPRKPGRRAREATLGVRFAPVIIRPPTHRKSARGLPSISVFAVYAHEEDPPKGVEPVSWMLLSTVPVYSYEDAVRLVEWYTVRWTIEMFFKVLKSGCNAEERQLEAVDRLLRCLTLDSVVAWRILYLTTAGRQTPDLPCTVVFEDSEWKSVWAYMHGSTAVPEEPPRLQDMVRMVGRLGGYLARRSDGPPGMIVLWRGLQRVPDLARMWDLFRGS